FQNAQAGLNEQEFTKGGLDLPSGVNAQLDASLQAQRAQQQAGEENQITLANEEQRQQNYWNAVKTEGGVADAYNPGGYIADSLNASAGVGGLADAATKANQSGFGSQLEGSIASGLGNFIRRQQSRQSHHPVRRHMADI